MSDANGVGRSDATLEERELAGKAYREDLVMRFAKAKMGAVDVCTTAYHHMKSGGLGADDLALDPSQAQNSSRRVKSALGLNASLPRRKIIWVPQWNNESARREILPLEVRLPHEVIAHDYEMHPHLYDKSMIDEYEWRVPQFVQHPVTLAHGEDNTFPIGYYSDKVALGKHEYFYRGSAGVTFIRYRLTLWIIKGNDICKCGCGGACTIDAIQIEMNHSFNLLQNAQYLKRRRDGRPWLQSDAWRQTAAARPLPIRGAVCEYRGDWPERCAKAGMKSHTANAGCPCCTAHKRGQHSRYAECSVERIPWPERDHERYLAELEQRLVKVRISNLDEKAEVVDALRWRVKFPWGRSVCPRRGKRWGLKTGDKLCISDDLTDLHSLEDLPVPFTLVFIRVIADSPIAGVSLMWNVPGVNTIKQF
jgi:hypothetical protein